jgi:excisionase family DNA binding protein
MLTSAEVRAKLRIGDKTLRRLIQSGAIEATKVGGGRWGGSYRITEEALAKYLQNQQVQVP